MLKAPDAPGHVALSIVDKTSLLVSWFTSNVDGDTVRSYRVERMTKSTFTSATNSFFGVQEIQVVSSASTVAATNLTSGNFTLAFGGLDDPLPGTVEVRSGDDDDVDTHAYVLGPSSPHLSPVLIVCRPSKTASISSPPPT